MKSIGERGKRMRQGKVAATAEEAAWMNLIQEFGCIVCALHYGVKSKSEIHHLKSGDRRMGHLFTLPLCYAHHRGGAGDGDFISRHPWKRRFEKVYGFELDLLEKLKGLVK